MVVVGVCAMPKKTLSQPMLELLDRLRAFGDVDVVVFDEKFVLNSPIEEWPRVQVLIAFYSHGFPLDKAIAYSESEPRPFLINDLRMQRILMDRRLVYQLLKESNIPTPGYLVMNRDENNESTQTLEEYDDRIVIDGVSMSKPFVEKPVSGDDHNIYLYYPDGGGCRRLFRKVKNRSSEFCPHNLVRRTGSYIYEKFVETGRDIKVFAVGKSYAHSESRKSPTVDGIVERNRFGRERRQTECLTPEESSFAALVTTCFKQTVCGLDILRNGDHSFIIDVNGWSFVKGNSFYYDRCSRILRQMSKACPQAKIDPYSGKPCTVSKRNLVGVVGIFRHADRSPKQKIKVISYEKEIIDLLPIGKFKTESDKALLSAAVNLILARNDITNEKHLFALRRLSALLTSDVFETSICIRQDEKKDAVLVVCKWGGEITEAGMQQSQLLGSQIRQYIDEEAREGASFAPVAQIFSSPMDRARKSAEEFSKAFVSGSNAVLKGEISDYDVSELSSTECKNLIEDSKARLRDVLLNYKKGCSQFVSGNLRTIGPQTALYAIDCPSERLQSLDASLDALIRFFRKQQNSSSITLTSVSKPMLLYHGESLPLVYRRWQKLHRSFKGDTDGTWDVTKIPDIFDSAIYDMLHNTTLLSELKPLLIPILHVSRLLCDFVIPEEYGVSVDDKLEISAKLGKRLFSRIVDDCLSICHQPDSPNCSFYFLNESHMHIIRNKVLWSGFAKNRIVADNLELMPLGYCSHVLLKLYSQETETGLSNTVSIEVSPGAVEPPEIVKIPHLQEVAIPAPFAVDIPLEVFSDCFKS